MGASGACSAAERRQRCACGATRVDAVARSLGPPLRSMPPTAHSHCLLHDYAGERGAWLSLAATSCEVRVLRPGQAL